MFLKLSMQIEKLIPLCNALTMCFLASQLYLLFIFNMEIFFLNYMDTSIFKLNSIEYFTVFC